LIMVNPARQHFQSIERKHLLIMFDRLMFKANGKTGNQNLDTTRPAGRRKLVAETEGVGVKAHWKSLPVNREYKKTVPTLLNLSGRQ